MYGSTRRASVGLADRTGDHGVAFGNAEPGVLQMLDLRDWHAVVDEQNCGRDDE
jgi:hypothetical protein